MGDKMKKTSHGEIGFYIVKQVMFFYVMNVLLDPLDIGIGY